MTEEWQNYKFGIQIVVADWLSPTLGEVAARLRLAELLIALWCYGDKNQNSEPTKQGGP